MPDMLSSQVRLSAVKEQRQRRGSGRAGNGSARTKPVGIAIGAST